MISPDIVPKSVVILHARSCKIMDLIVSRSCENFFLGVSHEDFNQQQSLTNFLTEVHKLLKLYLKIPVTTASSEHYFSALKRIKTSLRNSMTH